MANEIFTRRLLRTSKFVHQLCEKPLHPPNPCLNLCCGKERAAVLQWLVRSMATVDRYSQERHIYAAWTAVVTLRITTRKPPLRSCCLIQRSEIAITGYPLPLEPLSGLEAGLEVEDTIPRRGDCTQRATRAKHQSRKARTSFHAYTSCHSPKAVQEGFTFKKAPPSTRPK